MSVVIELEHIGDVCVVRMIGRVVVGSDVTYLSSTAEKIRGHKYGRILIDLSEAPFIDSTALGFLVGLYTSVTNAGGRFVVAGLNPRVRDVLDLTRLSSIIPLAADPKSGLEKLRAGAASA